MQCRQYRGNARSYTFQTPRPSRLSPGCEEPTRGKTASTTCGTRTRSANAPTRSRICSTGMSVPNTRSAIRGESSHPRIVCQPMVYNPAKTPKAKPKPKPPNHQGRPRHAAGLSWPHRGAQPPKTPLSSPGTHERRGYSPSRPRTALRPSLAVAPSRGLSLSAYRASRALTAGSRPLTGLWGPGSHCPRLPTGLRAPPEPFHTASGCLVRQAASVTKERCAYCLNTSCLWPFRRVRRPVPSPFLVLDRT